jgi:ubiquinone/menaquinone biosynthesis C-methylase UbiE
VLELACGTGAVTRVLAELLPDVAKLVATDLSEDMLQFAQQRLKHSASIEWHVANSLELPFEGNSFDLVVCQFGLMMIPDKLAAIKEAFRVLAAGGQILYSTWGNIESNLFFGVIEKTLSEMFPLEETPFMPTPMSMADPNLHRQLLQEAGFGNIEVEEEVQMVGPHVPNSLASGFCYGTPLGMYLSAQGYDLDEIHSRLSASFAEVLGDPMFVGKQAIVCSAAKG